MTTPMTPDLDRGRVLTVMTGAAAAVGAVSAGLPLAKYLGMPEWQRRYSERYFIDIDISRLEPGEMLQITWRQAPVAILHRTSAVIEQLRRPNAELKDPTSTEPVQPDATVNPLRSLRPEILVAYRVCTHLGCSVNHVPAGDAEWRSIAAHYGDGGFFCPCHGAFYDLAGRVYRDMPAPRNLFIPHHRFVSDDVIRIGEVPKGERPISFR